MLPDLLEEGLGFALQLSRRLPDLLDNVIIVQVPQAVVDVAALVMDLQDPLSLVEESLLRQGRILPRFELFRILDDLVENWLVLVN